MSDSMEGAEESRPSTPESYQTGEGGSLPPSPGDREHIDHTILRRAQSADGTMYRKRLLVAEVCSSTSGIVNAASEEARGEMGPHKPFGRQTAVEAWETLTTQKRLWFPIPISWRDIPELRGTTLFFNKYPNVYNESEKPDVTKIYALEPSIQDQDIAQCRLNVRRIGPRLLETIRRTTAPPDVGPNDTEARISVEEVPPVNPFPSHLLVIEQHPPIMGHRHRTFIPVHDVVILCFMARVNLPPRVDPKPLQKGDKIEITVPIARLAIPHPRVFDKIMSYMYSAYKSADVISFFDLHMGYAGLPEAARIEAASSLPRLLRVPFLKPESRKLWIEWSKQTEGRIAAQLCMTFCYERLIDMMKDANMQFENIKVLMMWDNLFEAGILLCRRLLLSAMTLSVVRDHLL